MKEADRTQRVMHLQESATQTICVSRRPRGNGTRREFLKLGAAAVALTGVGIGCARRETSTARVPEIRLPFEGDLPSLGGAREWLNSAPRSGPDLRGSVVLVNFWT